MFAHADAVHTCMWPSATQPDTRPPNGGLSSCRRPSKPYHQQAADPGRRRRRISESESEKRSGAPSGSGPAVAWLDTPAAEPPRLEVKYYPLSAFVAALIGLFIGRASNGLMVGVVYIKIVMLLFMAVPILSFLVGISQPLLSAVCYLVPSQATFEGIMDLSTGNGTAAVKDIFILLAHCIGWFLLYIGLSVHQRKNA